MKQPDWDALKASVKNKKAEPVFVTCVWPNKKKDVTTNEEHWNTIRGTKAQVLKITAQKVQALFCPLYIVPVVYRRILEKVGS